MWDEFCAGDREMIKPTYGQPISAEVLQQTKAYFEQLMVLLHPFMPFLTEELWQNLAPRNGKESIQFAAWPSYAQADASLLASFEHARTLVTEIRNFRSGKGLSPKEEFTLFAVGAERVAFEASIAKLANLTSIENVAERPEGTLGVLVDTRAYGLPLPDSLDTDAERTKIAKEIEYQRGFLQSVQKKLSNERFVAGAPEAVVAAERKKQADAEARIVVLEEQLRQLV